MDAICLLVAGMVRAMLPTTEFTLAWDHSVEKTRWEERYRVSGDELTLFEARVQGLGAGMEPASGATLHDGQWSWRPAVARLDELRLTQSSYTRDWQLCWNTGCHALGDVVGTAPEGSVIAIQPCAMAGRAMSPRTFE